MLSNPIFPATNIGYGSGGNPFLQSCGPNAFVTGFGGQSGTIVDQLEIAQCSDGSFPPVNNQYNGSTTTIGGGGGQAYGPLRCATGFNQATVSAGSLINQITFYCDDAELQTIGKDPASGGGAVNQTYQCPAGQVIQGISGQSGYYVDNIQFHCGYRSNCADSANVFSPNCSQLATQNPVLFQQNVNSYCAKNFDENCKNYALQNLGGFDQPVANYCAQSSSATDPFCSCYIPMKADPSLSPALLDLFNAQPACLNPSCVIHGYKNINLVQTTKNCNTQILSCVQNTTVNNNGQITGSVGITDSANCAQYRSNNAPSTPSVNPPGSAPAPSPSTPGTSTTSSSYFYPILIVSLVVLVAAVVLYVLYRRRTRLAQSSQVVQRIAGMPNVPPQSQVGGQPVQFVQR